MVDEKLIPKFYMDRRCEGDTVLRQCQLVELHLLHVLDEICKKFDLTYFLSGGTLLGAMRHDGFIPWDDDIDVAMPMRDFKRFLKVARSVLPEDVSLQAPGDEPRSGYKFAKLRDRYSFFFEPHARVPSASDSGIFIDIFPYEDSPRIPDGMRRWIGRVVNGAYQHQLNSLFKVTECALGLVPFYYLAAIFYWGVRFSIRCVWYCLQHMLPSGNICFVLEFWDRKRCFSRKLIEPCGQHRFEDGEFPIPNCPEIPLEQAYGNWKELPPPGKRTTHTLFADPFRSADGLVYPVKFA